MAEKSDVSKWVTYPARAAVSAVVGAGLFLLGRSFEVPGSTDFWDLAAQPLATTVAGAGAIAAGLLALHNGAKTRALDGTHHQQTMDRDRETNLRDRYTTAAQQLGDEQETIREAGVHALAALVDDWLRHGADNWSRYGSGTTVQVQAHSQARVCVHLLCSYLRANRRVDITESEFSKTEAAVRGSIIGVLRERTSGWRTVEDEWIAANLITDSDRIVIDVSGAILRDADLTGADLRRAVLVGTDLRDAHLFECQLERARLARANFRSANLVFANLSGADISDANFSEAVVMKTNFSKAVAAAAEFSETSLVGANFHGADLRGAKFAAATNLDGASFDKETLYSDSTTWPGNVIPNGITHLGDDTWVRRRSI